MIHRPPNGETHLRDDYYFLALGPGLTNHFISEVFHTEYIGVEKRTRGIETSKYPQEKKSNEIPLVVASERGPGLKSIKQEADGKPRHSG